MAGNRVLEPPRNLDPQLRLRSSVADLEARLALLERRTAGTIYNFPTASGTLDLVVPPTARLVTLAYECEMPYGSNLYVQPNASTTSIVNDYTYMSSTLSPNAITNPPAAAQGAFPGLLLVANLGAAGAIRAAGRVLLVARNYSGRTVARGDSTYTNTIGSSNCYLVNMTTSFAYDLSADLSSIRFTLSAGNFNGGAVVATFA